ncbi:MAG: FAD-binding oxidoreductase [Planctomycetes bacterium]|nr:FAD-binding oxidoreductase [Planctomycetota bacterium]MCB9868894.1 FAD-binding oxidoreductase [Planctomycetota bacterium]
MIPGTPLDYPVVGMTTVSDAAQLRDALAAGDPVRLVGGGSKQLQLPAPDQPVRLVSLAGMDRILRLEADDLTCSVQPGVQRRELDAELADRRLCLPCRGTGTIGGIFAADAEGPSGAGQPSPRSLLLGVSAMLTEGLAFKSGARVVKNVAGFDLQKVFVGSRGRLFAVTELHLKLRPIPRAELHFANRDLTTVAALDLARRLRATSTPPAWLELLGIRDRVTVQGTLRGHPRHLDEFAGRHGLKPCEALPVLPIVAGEHREVVRARSPFAAVPRLLERVPEGTLFSVTGSTFTVAVPPPIADALLALLPELQGSAEIVAGAAPRRGACSARDPHAAQLEHALRHALDPRGVLR